MTDDPRIDPADLRGVRFPRSFGRYEARAVDEFLESVARRIEATNELIDDLQARLGDAADAPVASSSAFTVLPGSADADAPPEPGAETEPPSPFDQPAPAEPPDLATLSDEELSQLVGDETAHVLSTARSAAADIRSKAEDSAARVIREATAEAKRLTDEAREQADELNAEASSAHETAVAEAEDAAAAIRAAAEEEAARITADAERAAAEATEEAEQIRAAAEEEAAAAVEEARTEGRSMVAEAKRVRARILTDLQRRRDIGREQVDRLVAGRNRLLDAYAAVRSNVDEITSQLDTALAEAAEPDIGLDEEVADAVADAEATAEDIRAHAPTPAGDDIDIDTDTDTGAEAGAGGDAAGVATERGAADEGSAPAEDPAGPSDDAAGPPEDTDASAGTGDGEAAPDDDAPTADAPTAHARSDAVDRDGDEAHEAADTADEGGGVDALFDRIRSERAQSVARAQQVLGADAAGDAPADADTEDVGTAADADTAAGAAAGTAAEGGSDGGDQLPAEMRAEGPVHEHRAETMETLERALARALKRHLADEQNEVLDALRTSESTVVDDLLPTEADHVNGYAVAATEHLVAAARAGASQVEGSDTPDVDDDAADVAAVLGETLIAPFRRRIERSAADVDGDADALDERLRALYREWKVEHLGPAAGDAIVAAYSAGQLAAASDDASLRWLIEPGSRSCPDCHDNALAGAISKGQPFPTEVDHPPAHPGCRCLLAVEG